MPADVLIAYATRGGSTGEVAEMIGAKMRGAGLKVEVVRARDLKSAGVRTAVVLGAPLYIGAIPAEMKRFLSRNRAALAASRTWFFMLGPIEDKPEEFAKARAQAEKVLAKFSWLKPEELRIFGGKFDIDRIPAPYNLLRYLPAFPGKQIVASDCRDWGAIRGWADEIARWFLPGS